MFGADKRYLSICISDTSVKIGQVRSSGVVEKIARGFAASTAAEDIVRTLKPLLAGFNKKSPVICAIPAGAATSKRIEVPSTDPKEIRSIINLQASRHTPYSRDEVLISYLNLGVSSNGITKILLVIAHRHIVKDRLAILEQCGLDAQRVQFVPEGVGRLYFKGLNLKFSSPPVGLIDVNANAVNFMIISRGAVSFARSIPMGIKQILENSESSDKLAEELAMSLTAYQSEDTENLAFFLVTTEHSALKNILPKLQDALKLEVRLSPYTNFIKAGAVKNRLQKDFPDDSFLDVIGPAVHASKSEVNLIPDEIVMKRNVELQSREAIRAGIAAAVIMVLLAATFFSKIYFLDAFLNQKLRDQYSGQKQEVSQLQERMAKTRIARDYLQGRMVGLETLNELYRITPKEIYLNSIALDEEGVLNISGVSESMSLVFSYVKSLDDSPMFFNAKTKSTSTKKDNNKDMAVFEVALKIKDPLQGARP